MKDWELNNQYFMKFCDETRSSRCKEIQCQYRLYCNRYRFLKIKETEKNIKEKGIKK